MAIRPRQRSSTPTQSLWHCGLYHFDHAYTGPGTNAQRQSPPSPPAVLTVDQTIELDPLPSSVSISSSTLQVKATALSNGHHQQSTRELYSYRTVFGRTFDDRWTGISSATVTLNSTGSCIITASQGDNSTTVSQARIYRADPVSGTFMIVSANSNTISQTINFPQLASVQYGSSPVPVSATASPIKLHGQLHHIGTMQRSFWQCHQDQRRRNLQGHRIGTIRSRTEQHDLQRRICYTVLQHRSCGAQRHCGQPDGQLWPADSVLGKRLHHHRLR